MHGTDGDAAARAAGELGDEGIHRAAREFFGEGLPVAERYAGLLATDGVVRGLIGPREAPRIWERHLLNCAAIAPLIPFGSYVIDIGSGAGLPGIVLAAARPDLRIDLVEPLARRSSFLTEMVEVLDLPKARVVRRRAEECVGELAPADVVTARAVASLDRLAAWGLPLTAIGGRLVAIKGASADAEVAEHGAAVTRLGGGAPTVRVCGPDLLASPTTVIEIVRERGMTQARSPRRGRDRARR